MLNQFYWWKYSKLFDNKSFLTTYRLLWPRSTIACSRSKKQKMTKDSFWLLFWGSFRESIISVYRLRRGFQGFLGRWSNALWQDKKSFRHFGPDWAGTTAIYPPRLRIYRLCVDVHWTVSSGFCWAISIVVSKARQSTALLSQMEIGLDLRDSTLSLR